VSALVQADGVRNRRLHLNVNLCKGRPENCRAVANREVSDQGKRVRSSHSRCEIAILRLPPAELAKFRAWFAEFEAGRVNKKSEPQDTASRLGRIAGRTFADLRKRLREP